MKLSVTFSIDPTGFDQDISTTINLPSNTCLLCLHDKESRFVEEIKNSLHSLGYETRYYFQLMKVYSV